MIEGVAVTRLAMHVDERGRVAELYRNDEEGLPRFGQVHLTTVRPGVIKAWHRHMHRTDVIACVAGTLRLGLYDPREGSKTERELEEYFLSAHTPLRITIPPKVWFGMKNVGDEEALILVWTDEPYDPHVPDEERLDPEANDIPLDWDRRDF